MHAIPTIIARHADSQTPSPVIPPLDRQLESLPQMVQGVQSNDPAMQLEATTQFRKLLSIERAPPSRR